VATLSTEPSEAHVGLVRAGRRGQSLVLRLGHQGVTRTVVSARRFVGGGVDCALPVIIMQASPARAKRTDMSPARRFAEDVALNHACSARRARFRRPLPDVLVTPA